MAALYLNDAGTWRQIQSVYVNDAGTWRTIQKIWVNDSGTWRQVYIRRPAESGFVTAGTNGTAYGYVRSNYGSISGFPGTGGNLTDGYRIDNCNDTGAAGSNAVLAINGITGMPPDTYFTSVVAHGQTRLASAASISSFGTTKIWTWSGTPFGWYLDPGTLTAVTINF